MAKAKVFAAGILPNPQFTFDYGFLTGGPGTTTSLAAGLAQDAIPLLTLASRKSATCGFSTLAQCQASIIGGTDQCFQNPTYVPPGPPAGPHKEQKHKDGATKQ